MMKITLGRGNAWDCSAAEQGLMEFFKCSRTISFYTARSSNTEATFIRTDLCQL